MPLFVNSEYLSGEPYYSNSYPKAATFFKMLHDLLGDDVFMDCHHTFIDRWNGKHPTPYDFIFTFEDVSGEDLSWFIKPWVFEYGYVDFEVKSFEKIDDGISVNIEKVGHYPAPIDLLIIYDDGSEDIIHKNAGIWKSGNSSYTFEIKTRKQVKSVNLLDMLGIDAEE
jgi:aminopeptidase N